MKFSIAMIFRSICLPFVVHSDSEKHVPLKLAVDPQISFGNLTTEKIPNPASENIQLQDQATVKSGSCQEPDLTLTSQSELYSTRADYQAKRDSTTNERDPSREIHTWPRKKSIFQKFRLKCQNTTFLLNYYPQKICTKESKLSSPRSFTICKIQLKTNFLPKFEFLT